MSAATQRFTENGRPAIRRWFLSAVIGGACYAAVAVTGDGPQWRGNDAGGVCRAGDDGRGEFAVTVTVVVVASTATDTTVVVGGGGEQQQRARRQLRHCVTRHAARAVCMSAAVHRRSLFAAARDVRALLVLHGTITPSGRTACGRRRLRQLIIGCLEKATRKK